MYSSPITVSSRNGYFGGDGVLELVVSPALSRCLPGPRHPDELDDFILATGAAPRRKVRAVEFDLNFPKLLSVFVLLSDYEWFRPLVRRWVRIAMLLLRHKATPDCGVPPPSKLPSWCLAAGIVESLARPVKGGDPDPFLHAHIVMCSQAVDPETGQRLALDLNRARTAWPGIQKYLHVLAAHDLARHGVSVLGAGAKCWLETVPYELEEKFSTRTAEVKAAGLKHNRFRRAESKVRDRSHSDLVAVWRAKLSPEISEALLMEAQRMQSPPRVQSPWSEVDHNAGDCLENAVGRHLLADELEVLTEAPAGLLAGVSPNRLRRSLRRLFRKDRRYRSKTQEILSFGLRSHSVYASRESVDLVAATLPLVRASHGLHAPWVSSQSAYAEGQPNMRSLLRSMHQQRDAVVILQVPDDREHWQRKDRLYGELSLQATVRGYLGEAAIPPKSLKWLYQPFGPAYEQLEGSLQSGDVVWIEGADRVDPRRILNIVKLVLLRSARIILSVNPGRRPFKSATGLLPMLRLDAGVALLSATKEASRTESHLLTDLRFGKGVELVCEPSFDKEPPLELVVDTLFKALQEDQVALTICGTPEEEAELNRAVAQRGFGKERVKVMRLVPRHLDESEARQPQSYARGDVVVLAQPMQGFASGTRLRVLGAVARGVLVQERDLGVLPLDQGRPFSVYREQECRLGAHDQVRITRRSRRQGQYDLHEGDVVRVAGVEDDGSIRLAGDKVLPADFGHLEPFYACLPADLPRRVDTAIILHSAFEQMTADQLAPVVRGKVHLFGVDSAGLLDWLWRGAARVLDAALEAEDRVRPAVAALHLCGSSVTRNETSPAETQKTPPAMAEVPLPSQGAPAPANNGGLRIPASCLEQVVRPGANRVPAKPKKRAEKPAAKPGSPQGPETPSVGK